MRNIPIESHPNGLQSYFVEFFSSRFAFRQNWNRLEFHDSAIFSLTRSRILFHSVARYLFLIYLSLKTNAFAFARMFGLWFLMKNTMSNVHWNRTTHVIFRRLCLNKRKQLPTDGSHSQTHTSKPRCPHRRHINPTRTHLNCEAHNVRVYFRSAFQILNIYIFPLKTVSAVDREWWFARAIHNSM